MAKIGLTSGFAVIPEGTHVFKITAVAYDEDFGKLQYTMQTENGDKHIERFTLLDKKGKVNQGALNAFSYFAKVALNDFSVTEIDHEDLVGHFMECDVEHDIQPNRNDPSKNVTFVRLADKRPSDGWKEAPSAPKRGGKPDLKAILGS